MRVLLLTLQCAADTVSGAVVPTELAQEPATHGHQVKVRPLSPSVPFAIGRALIGAVTHTGGSGRPQKGS